MKISTKTVWSWIFRLTGLGSAIDSVIALHPHLLQQISAFTQNDLAISIVETIIIFIYLFVVDFSLMAFLKKGLYVVFLNTPDRRQVIGIGYATIFYCVVMTAATVSISFILRESAAGHFVPPPSPPTLPLSNEIADTADEADAELKELTSLRKREIEKSQTVSLVKLKNAGNVWAANQLAAREAAAAARIDLRIKKAAERIAKTKNLKAIADAKKSDVEIQKVSLLQKDYEVKLAEWKKKTSALANFLLYFAVGATIIQWYAAAMLAVISARFYRNDEEFALIPSAHIRRQIADSQHKNPKTEGEKTNTENPRKVLDGKDSSEKSEQNKESEASFSKSSFGYTAPASFVEDKNEDLSFVSDAAIDSKELLDLTLSKARKYHSRYIAASAAEKRKPQVIEHNLKKRNYYIALLEDIGLSIITNQEGGLSAPNLKKVRDSLRSKT